MGLFDVFKKKNKPTIEEIYMARDLKEIENTLLSSSGFYQKEDREAYIYKLFFSPKEEGGFGFPIARKDEIINGCIKDKISYVFLGVYKTGRKLNNYLLEYARVFFGKGLKEADSLVMGSAIIRLIGLWGEINQNGSVERFYQELLSNPESFLYDQRLYQGDSSFVEYKMNFCFNVFYFDYYAKIRENMAIEEVLSAPSIAYLKQRESDIQGEDSIDD